MITLKIWHGPMRTTLTLPLREAEIQKALVKAFHTAPFKVTADELSPEALAMLNGKEIDLDELNFLAKNLDRFTPYEQDQFFAAVQAEQPSDLKALINLSFNMERYTLVQNVTDLAAVGRKYLLSTMGALPASEIDNLDFEQAGRDLLTSGNGTPTTYGLLFTSKDVPYHEVYHGATFPYCEPRRDIIAVAKMEYGPKTEYLYLPEDELAVIKAARRMGAPSPDMCKVALTDFMLDDPTWIQHLEKFKRCHAYETALELKAEGKFRHFGISFHDRAEVLEQILTEYPQIELVQIQFNYVDYEDPSVESRKCYEVCVKHGKPVVVMEPVKGGSLVNLPEAAQKVFDDLGNGMSNASYAIRFAAGFENIKVVLSGMGNMEMVEDNTGYMQDFKPLSPAEQEAVKKVTEIFRSQNLIPCTACRYCMEECPKGIHIPDLFSLLNAKKAFDNWNTDYYYNNIHTTEGTKAKDCLKCGKCERICPQHLEIRKLLEDVSREFDK